MERSRVQGITEGGLDETNNGWRGHEVHEIRKQDLNKTDKGWRDQESYKIREDGKAEQVRGTEIMRFMK